MDTNSINSSTAAAAASSSAATSALNSDFNTFIELLTTQVTNQDPLSPLDSTQFVEQLATFSALEQQIATNAHLEDITRMLQASLGGVGASLIGEEAAAQSVNVDGPINPLTVVAAEGAEGTLVVRNSSGNEVYRGTSGSEWRWNGRDNSGQLVAPGTYSFSVVNDQGAQPAFAVGTVDRTLSTDNGIEIGFGPGVTAVNYELVPDTAE